MTAITINIPNHEVSFFKKMIAKMGWTYSEADVVRSAATPHEQALAKVDHAFGQLRQMKDGQLQGINAEELLVTIYDRSTFGRLQGKKSDQASISNRELRKLMKKNGLE